MIRPTNKSINSKYVVLLSTSLVVFAYLFAAAAIPFILIAGTGLLIAVPFIYFAYKEWEEILPLLRKKEPLPDVLRQKRALRVAMCTAGMTALLGLVWWANSGKTRVNPVVSFSHNLLWTALISLLLLSPQLLYRKK